jgi:hypothetical protein
MLYYQYLYQTLHTLSMHYTQGERAITYHADPVRVGHSSVILLKRECEKYLRQINYCGENKVCVFNGKLMSP